MADATVTLYRALVPAHAAIPSATVSTFLTQASAMHSPSAFGVMFDTAMVYYAAHMIEKTPGLGSSLATETGAVVSQVDGVLSRSYAPLPSASMDERSSWLQQTTYGQQYLAIRAALPSTKGAWISVA